jgi:hypothetical protein
VFFFGLGCVGVSPGVFAPLSGFYEIIRKRTFKQGDAVMPNENKVLRFLKCWCCSFSILEKHKKIAEIF